MPSWWTTRCGQSTWTMVLSCHHSMWTWPRNDSNRECNTSGEPLKHRMTGCVSEQPLPWEPAPHSPLVMGCSHGTWSDNADIDLIRLQKLCLLTTGTTISRYGVSPWAKFSNISLAYPRKLRHRIRKREKIWKGYWVISSTIIYFFLGHSTLPHSNRIISF